MSDELPGYDAWLTTPPDECAHDEDDWCGLCDPERLADAEWDAGERRYDEMKEEGLR